MRIDRSKVFTTLFASLVALASATAAHASDFTIGGTVSGLISGRSVTLLDNGVDALKVTANGKFTFTTALASGAAYKVTVSVQPAGETCTVTGGSGTVGSANVTSVAVACKANDYTIGGTVSGLISGGSVTLLDNGGRFVQGDGERKIYFYDSVGQRRDLQGHRRYAAYGRNLHGDRGYRHRRHSQRHHSQSGVQSLRPTPSAARSPGCSPAVL